MAPPPELIDDATAEILLRLPPDNPACLFRCALVCKTWRRIIYGPAFPRRYRAFHGAPPVLGFVHNFPELSGNPRFVPIAEGSPLIQPAFDFPRGQVLGCRHGRVLLDRRSGGLAVWNPITGDRTVLHGLLRDFFYSAAVLCAAAGCNHCDCHGGPFLLVFLASDYNELRAWVYSSEAAAWSAPTSPLTADSYITTRNNGALVGDEICFLLDTTILKYNLGNHCLSVIDSPELYHQSTVLMPMEDGSLGLAGVRDSSLHLWSRKVDPDGVAEWVRYRIVDLKQSLPIGKFNERVSVIGSAEGRGVIFVGTDCSAFTFELNSGRWMKVIKHGRYNGVLPFMSFYTPDFASRKLPLPEETD